MKTKTLLLVWLTFCSVCLFSQIIFVPANHPTIQMGINASENGDTIVVSEGTYYENIRFFGKAITLASYFLLDGNDDHINNTIIDGSTASNPNIASAVMFIDSEDTTSVLCGLTILGGAGLVTTSPGLNFGGGIACWESGPKISNCKIKDNVISHPSYKCGGGGIACISNTGQHTLVVEHCTISSNLLTANAISAFGSGIYSEINSIIRNNTISGNNCFNASFKSEGGGIAIKKFGEFPVTAFIFNNTIKDNLSHGTNAIGGGIAIFHANVTIEGNEILNNMASASGNADGGGIYLENTLDGSYIYNNIIDGNKIEGEEFAWGGGIGSVFAGELHISINQITNNTCEGTAVYGGAMNLSGPTGKLYILGNEISQNYMTGIDYWFGAGMWIDTYSDQVIIRNNLVKDNGGNEVNIWSLGGGIAIYTASGNESVTIKKNIIRQNYAERGGGIWAYNTYNCSVTNNVFFWNNAVNNGGAINFREYTGKGPCPYSIKSKSKIQPNNQKQLDTFHPAVINNTFFGNSAEDYGGAIYSDHELNVPVILNSVFHINEAQYGKDIYNYSDSTTLIVDHSVIDTAEINSLWAGENNIHANPELQDDSCHLFGTSPCINAGIESVEYFGQTFLCPDEDIDGQPRPLNTAPEIGVDEVLSTNSEEFLTTITKKESPIKCYPNPASDVVNIRSDLDLISLSIFNNRGIEVLQRKLANNYFQVNTSTFSSGIYIFKVMTAEGTILKRVAIK